jgi:hypothetical protein
VPRGDVERGDNWIDRNLLQVVCTIVLACWLAMGWYECEGLGFVVTVRLEEPTAHSGSRRVVGFDWRGIRGIVGFKELPCLQENLRFNQGPQYLCLSPVGQTNQL